jgi:hypothetical protein
MFKTSMLFFYVTGNMWNADLVVRCSACQIVEYTSKAGCRLLSSQTLFYGCVRRVLAQFNIKHGTHNIKIFLSDFKQS